MSEPLSEERYELIVELVRSAVDADGWIGHGREDAPYPGMWVSIRREDVAVVTAAIRFCGLDIWEVSSVLTGVGLVIRERDPAPIDDPVALEQWLSS